jgi:CPA2 family monovalent cation:H+ antiporter-2
MRRVIRIVQDQREARYNLLRGFFHGADDDMDDDRQLDRLVSVTLTGSASATGRRLNEFDFSPYGVRVMSLRRGNGKLVADTDNLQLLEGDTLVLTGKAEALVLAEEMLLQG